MAHDCSGPDGLHKQAIADSSQSVSRFLRGTPTVQYKLHTKAQKGSAARLFAAGSALRLRSLPSSRHLVISPLHRAFHTTTPSSSPHRHALSSTRAPQPLLLCARAPHPPLFFAAPRPPLFAPARRICPFLCPPPSRHPHAMQVALYSRSFLSSMRSTSFPVPPSGLYRSVHSSLVHFLMHLAASAVDLPLRVAARRVLCLFALLTIAL